MILDTKDYVVKQISHLSKGVPLMLGGVSGVASFIPFHQFYSSLSVMSIDSNFINGLIK